MNNSKTVWPFAVTQCNLALVRLCFKVENVMDDVDFKAKVTREELETMCEDIFEKIGKVIEEALRSSEMTMVSA